MSKYASRQDMIDRFGETEIEQIAGRTALDTIDDEVLARALEDADAEIDGYLATRYPVPFDPIPRLLVRIACDVARYLLYDDEAPEEVRRRYEDVIKTLGGMSKGTISLGADAVSPSIPQLAMTICTGPSVFRRRRNGGLR